MSLIAEWRDKEWGVSEFVCRSIEIIQSELKKKINF